MLALTLIVLLAISLALGRREPRATAIVDLLVASLLFLFRLLPGGAEWYAWAFAGIFLSLSLLLTFGWKEIYT